jgi:hypothetical protein
MSNLFVSALNKAQIELMGRTTSECSVLVQDVKTRWNSTFNMVVSILKVKEALLYVLDLPQFKSSKHLVTSFLFTCF